MVDLEEIQKHLKKWNDKINNCIEKGNHLGRVAPEYINQSDTRAVKCNICKSVYHQEISYEERKIFRELMSEGCVGEPLSQETMAKQERLRELSTSKLDHLKYF